MAAKTYSVDELAHLTGLSVSGIKKAIAEKRIKARKIGRSWAIDPSDPTVQGWLTKADVVKSPNVQALTEEISKLRRENANLAKRVRQAEAGQRRAERETRQLEAELAEAYKSSTEQAHENARKIYSLSHEVIEKASQENTRTLLKVVSMLANADAPQQILAAEVAPEEATPEAQNR